MTILSENTRWLWPDNERPLQAYVKQFGTQICCYQYIDNRNSEYPYGQYARSWSHGIAKSDIVGLPFLYYAGEGWNVRLVKGMLVSTALIKEAPVEVVHLNNEVCYVLVKDELKRIHFGEIVGVFDPSIADLQMPVKIYGFFNSVNLYRDAMGVAVDEYGKWVARHVSSSESFSVHDLGMSRGSTRHHDEYDAEHGYGGWVPEFVLAKHRDNHPGFQAALAAHDAIEKL